MASTDGETVGKGENVGRERRPQGREYNFYCAVGNHRAEGMEGTLTVE